MDLKKLQKIEDGYLAWLKNYLPTEAAGKWDWPAYGLTDISAVVLGHRHVRGPHGERWIEVVYALTFTSKQPIPHAGDGKHEVHADGSHFVFTQLGASVNCASGYLTHGISTYVGGEPHLQQARKSPKKAGGVRALALMLDPPTKPHPPP